jgi:D-sedoheptulose 7-phosphate isomerase
MKKIKLNYNNFINDYLHDVDKAIEETVKVQKKKIVSLVEKIKKVKKNKKKVLIFGNGGSAATASHFSVDLTKNAKIRSINFNESDLITCLANDYGHDNWVKKAIEFYIDKDDLVILISTSGNSQNVINAAKFLKQKKFSFFSLSGMKKNNLLNKISKPNNCIWVNNMSYNQIEIIHHLILLLTIDILIGKSVYKS